MRYVPGSFDDDHVYSELQRTLAEFDERAGHPLDRGPKLADRLLDAPLVEQDLSQIPVRLERACIKPQRGFKCLNGLARLIGRRECDSQIVVGIGRPGRQRQRLPEMLDRVRGFAGAQ